MVLIFSLDGRSFHPLAQAHQDLCWLEGMVTRVGLVFRSRLTSHWRRPNPPAPGPRGLPPMPSPYGLHYPNWLPHRVTQGPRWPGRTTGCRYIIHIYAHRYPTQETPKTAIWASSVRESRCEEDVACSRFRLHFIWAEGLTFWSFSGFWKLHCSPCIPRELRSHSPYELKLGPEVDMR